MAVTATAAKTLKTTLNQANPNEIADALQKVGLGAMVEPTKITYVGLASAAAHNITDAAHGSARPINSVIAVRVTAGAAAAGLRQIGDSGAAPSATVASLSDDGKTLTFEAGVTAFVLFYTPASAVDPDALFNRS